MNTTTRRAWSAAVLIIIMLIGTLPAIAHHSFAMYDTAKEMTMTGKLIRFIIGANHSQYVMQVLKADGTVAKDSKGQPVVWTIETTSAAQLAAKDITVETFKYDDIFTVTFNPLRDGRNGGAQQMGAILIICGPKMPAGGCNEKTGKKYQ